MIPGEGKAGIAACTQLYTNFCRNYSSGYNCTMDFNPTIDSLVPPPSCIQTESVKNTSVVNVSFYDYFKPGINIFFSYENKTSGKPGLVVSPFNKTLDLQDSTLYIVYLNSFANTRFPPQEIKLPPECAPVSWYNNYPSNCWDYCVRAVGVYGSTLGAAASYNPGVLSIGSSVAVGAAAGVGYNYCTQNSFCNNYVIPSGFQTITTLAWTTSGLGNCFSCVGSVPQFLGSNVLGRNLVFVCAQTS